MTVPLVALEWKPNLDPAAANPFDVGPDALELFLQARVAAV